METISSLGCSVPSVRRTVVGWVMIFPRDDVSDVLFDIIGQPQRYVRVRSSALGR